MKVDQARYGQIKAYQKSLYPIDIDQLPKYGSVRVKVGFKVSSSTTYAYLHQWMLKIPFKNDVYFIHRLRKASWSGRI